MKTWKTSRDPDYAAKKARVENLYAIADVEVITEDGEPEVVLCLDEFGPLNLQPPPGRQWAERGGRHKAPDREPRPRWRATYTRPHGGRHLFAAYDLAQDKLYGHIKPKKNRTRFLQFCRYLRSLYPSDIRIAIVLEVRPFGRHPGSRTGAAGAVPAAEHSLDQLPGPGASVVCLCPAPRCAHEAGRGPMKRAGAQPASGVMPCSLPAGGEGSSRAVSRSL